MKVIISVLLVIVSLFSVSLIYAEEQKSSVFQLTDAYFQVKGHKPVHLIHDSTQMQSVWLGDSFNVWIEIKIAEGFSSPCNRQDPNPCIMDLTIFGKIDGKEVEWKPWIGTIDFHIDANMSFASGGSISRKFDLGPGAIRFKVQRKDEVLYLYDIPIAIK